MAKPEEWGIHKKNKEVDICDIDTTHVRYGVLNWKWLKKKNMWLPNPLTNLTLTSPSNLSFFSQIPIKPITSY